MLTAARKRPSPRMRDLLWASQDSLARYSSCRVRVDGPVKERSRRMDFKVWSWRSWLRVLAWMLTKRCSSGLVLMRVAVSLPAPVPSLAKEFGHIAGVYLSLKSSYQTAGSRAVIVVIGIHCLQSRATSMCSFNLRQSWHPQCPEDVVRMHLGKQYVAKAHVHLTPGLFRDGIQQTANQDDPIMHGREKRVSPGFGEARMHPPKHEVEGIPHSPAT